MPDAPTKPDEPRRIWLRVYAGQSEAGTILRRIRGKPRGEDRLAGLGLWIHAQWVTPGAPNRHSIGEVGRWLKQAADEGVPALPGAVLNPVEWNDIRTWQARQRWLERFDPIVEQYGALALDFEQYSRPRPAPPGGQAARQEVMQLQEAVEPLARWASSIKDLICYPVSHRHGGRYTAVASFLGADTFGDEFTYQLCEEIMANDLTGSAKGEKQAEFWRDYLRKAYEFAGASQRRYLPGVLSSMLKPGRNSNLDEFDRFVGEPRELWAYCDDMPTVFTSPWFTEKPRPHPPRKAPPGRSKP